MKHQPSITIGINLSGRVLVVIGVIGLLAAVLVSTTGAQGSEPLDVNQLAVNTDATVQQPTPVSLPDAPEGFVWTVNGELISRDALGMRPDGLQSGTGVSAVAGGGRHFYLTNASFASNQALTACASGYHMASLWELIDPSNLTYDYDHPDAHTKADSGQGPPSLWYGRVRTGTDSSNSSTAGTGNCNNWTSVSGSDSGGFVRLTRTWETPPAEIGGIWDATSFACSSVGPVWCVRD